MLLEIMSYCYFSNSILSVRYDPQFNCWSKIAAMNSRRLGVGVAVLGGFLYAVGGSDGQSPLNTGSCQFALYVKLEDLDTISIIYFGSLGSDVCVWGFL